MKTCPTCNRTFNDSLFFCLEDGSALLQATVHNETETVFLASSPYTDFSKQSDRDFWKYAFLILVPALAIGLIVVLFFSFRSNNKDVGQIPSLQNSANVKNELPVNNLQNSLENKANLNSNLSTIAPETAPTPFPKRKDKPKFSEYPATEGFSGRNAPVMLSTSQDKTYKTFLKETSLKAPNFAGHYILSYVGCGTNCAEAAVVDAKTGKVFWFPETVNFALWNEEPDEEIVGYRLDSKLLIFHTLKTGSADNGYLQHYVFENNRFNLVYSAKAPRVF